MNWYGLLIALGLIACLAVAVYVSKKRGFHFKSVWDNAVWDTVLIPIALAFIGLRLWFVIFDAIGNGNSWTLLEIIGFRNGRFIGFQGLAIWGGILGALVGAILVSKVIMPKFFKDPARRISFWQMADIGMGIFLLGQAIGRWGNFVNQEAYGQLITSTAWWVRFPFAVNINGSHFHATFFYESLWNSIGFGIAMWLLIGKRRSFDGLVLAFFAIWYGTGRFFIEFLRSDAQLMWQGGPRVVQVICVAAILFGVGLIIFHIYKARQAGKKPFLFVPTEELSLDYYGYDKCRLYFNEQLAQSQPDDEDSSEDTDYKNDYDPNDPDYDLREDTPNENQEDS
ncbi:MAG: prolipoprotein diacylglyceryl transferase [Firmicutes bacterium]|nr:prolipoprotein diacylglyceryl transferase [Bacillota bacterium]